MLPAGIEPTIPASERTQTHASDRAVAGVDHQAMLRLKIRANETDALCSIRRGRENCIRILLGLFCTIRHTHFKPIHWSRPFKFSDNVILGTI